MAKMTLDYLISSIKQMNISNLSVDRDYASDNIVLTNMKNGNRTVVSRTELEYTNLPYSVIASAIEMIMPNTTPMPTVSSGTVSVGVSGSTGPIGPVGSTVSGGGGGYVVIDPFATYPSAGPAPHWIDDPHINDIKSKLFSYTDLRIISDIKQTIRAILFDTVPVHDLNMNHVVVAGGCFASLLNKESVKDYDVFFLDDERNREFMNIMVENCVARDDVKHGNTNYMNNEHIEETLFFKKSGVQYITTKFKTREDLVKHFDFKHCQVSYDFMNDKLYVSRETYDLIRTKTLVPNGNIKPAQWRFEKFESRGWKSDRHRHA